MHIADNSLRTFFFELNRVLQMIGTEIQKARSAAKLTQEDLAAKAGVHRTYVSLLERGLRSPTVEVLMRLCDALDLKTSELISRIEASSENH
jgi:transcriptional regulator with XRE-family HTH domain